MKQHDQPRSETDRQQPAGPVAHEDVTNDRQQQQEDREVQLELLIFVLIGKPETDEMLSNLYTWHS